MNITCRRKLRVFQKNQQTMNFKQLYFTWNTAEVICSPSCMLCWSWFWMVIFFSLVIEAMGTLRITVCSPTKNISQRSTASWFKLSELFTFYILYSICMISLTQMQERCNKVKAIIKAGMSIKIFSSFHEGHAKGPISSKKRNMYFLSQLTKLNQLIYFININIF